MLITSFGNRKPSPVTDFPIEETLDGLEALRQAARRAALRESLKSPGSGLGTAGKRLEDFHAEPLSPLRERDNQALSDLFERDDMQDIERDVSYRLLQLLPEPCWEDDPFEFLKDLIQL